MSKESIIKFLRAAEAYIACYPGLRVEYAVGLTAFDPALDPGIAERYAELLEGRELYDKCPGGEILEEYYERMLSRYEQMQRNLSVTVGYGLDPDDPDNLSETIGRLEKLPY